MTDEQLGEGAGEQTPVRSKRLDPSAFSEDSEVRSIVEIPELGGHVIVRSLSALEMDDYEVALAAGSFKSGYRAWLAYHCTVNDDGSLFFARQVDGKPVPKEEVMADLAKHRWGILTLISDKIAEISGPMVDLKDLKKSSIPGQAEPFSDSP